MYQNTVLKIENFSAIQILCEINFEWNQNVTNSRNLKLKIKIWKTKEFLNFHTLSKQIINHIHRCHFLVHTICKMFTLIVLQNFEVVWTNSRFECENTSRFLIILFMFFHNVAATEIFKCQDNYHSYYVLGNYFRTKYIMLFHCIPCLLILSPPTSF